MHTRETLKSELKNLLLQVADLDQSEDPSEVLDEAISELARDIQRKATRGAHLRLVHSAQPPLSVCS